MTTRSIHSTVLTASYSKEIFSSTHATMRTTTKKPYTTPALPKTTSQSHTVSPGAVTTTTTTTTTTITTTMPSTITTVVSPAVVPTTGVQFSSAKRESPSMFKSLKLGWVEMVVFWFLLM
jgi:hypothetical protein